MPNRVNQQKGFTLTELLVVLVILAIMASIAIFSYIGVISSARDSKRKADLVFLQKLLTVYYLDHGFFPTYTTAGISPLSCKLTLYPDSPECVNLISELRFYSAKIPFDPSDSYRQGADNCQKGNCYDYITPDPAHSVSCICAGLEDGSSRNKPSACSGSTYNYCLQVSF